MKKISLLMLLFAALFAGCSKEDDDEVTKVEDEFFSFDIKNEKTVHVDKDTINVMYNFQNLINVPYPISGFSSTAEADFKNNNTTTSLVKNIQLKELVIIMPDNSIENFSFLEKMDVHMALSDGSEQVLMAYNRNVPNDPTLKKVAFTPSGAPMDKYVKAGNYKLILSNTRMRRPVTADLDITARVTYSVTASPLK